MNVGFELKSKVYDIAPMSKVEDFMKIELEEYLNKWRKIDWFWMKMQIDWIINWLERKELDKGLD